VAFAKLCDGKTPITAADLLNDRVVPFFDEKEVKLSRVLTDRGTEYCSNPEHHEYELYLAVEDIDHSRKHLVKAGQDHQFDKAFDTKARNALVLDSLRNILQGTGRGQNLGNEVVGCWKHPLYESVMNPSFWSVR
jgi:hypothetical protein